MEWRGEPRLFQRQHVGKAIEDIGLHPAGLAFCKNFSRDHEVVGSRVLQGDARIFLLEGVLERPDDLVDDQRRVPDDRSFLLRRIDQGGILRLRA